VSCVVLFSLYCMVFGFYVFGPLVAFGGFLGSYIWCGSIGFVALAVAMGSIAREGVAPKSAWPARVAVFLSAVVIAITLLSLLTVRWHPSTWIHVDLVSALGIPLLLSCECTYWRVVRHHRRGKSMAMHRLFQAFVLLPAVIVLAGGLAQSGLRLFGLEAAVSKIAVLRAAWVCAVAAWAVGALECMLVFRRVYE